MRFPDRFLDDIRDRLRISEVVGSRVTFDKKKTNSMKGDYWANCPFHGEKTPSFHCEDRKGRYHCFGCGQSGDHFRFLTELDGLSFPEAVELLASQAGLPMPVMDKREQEREEQRKSLFDVMEMASKYFQMQLHEEQGAIARAYLRDRGLSPKTQQEFGLGFAPNGRNHLKEYLAANGAEPDQIKACGLVVHGDDIAVPYDRFRGRVMFPIPDSKGRVIAFGGRALASDALAKYLNSPETELFHKSNVLYNFAKARKPAYDKKQVIVAEGYMDVIALHAAGFDNAVAPLGTALTERQMELLWRMNSEPLLCFDGDEAGLKAAYRSIDMILPNLQAGRSVRFALLPEGMDPDDLIKQDGAQAMHDVLGASMPLVDMVWQREISSGLFDTPERRAKLEAGLREIINLIRDESVRRHYGHDIKSRLDGYFSTNAGYASNTRQNNNGNYSNRNFAPKKGIRSQAVGSRKMQASPSLLASKMVKKGHGGISLREAALIGGVVYHPALCVEFFEEVSSLRFENKEARNLQSVLLDCFANWSEEGSHPSVLFILEQMRAKEMGTAVLDVERILKENKLWQLLENAGFEDARDGWLQAHALYVKNQTLNQELKVAERALADDDSQENLERLLEIQQELSRSDGVEALIDGFGVSSGRPARGF